MLKSSSPVFTIGAEPGATRAFLMRSQNSQQEGGNQVRYEDVPAMTITAVEKPRAFLVDVNNASRDHTVRNADDPAMSVVANFGHRPVNMPRAWLSQGRVVALTPRALARLMSVPDSYMLPDKASLACRVLGNMVAPAVMQKLVESVKG